MNSLILYWSFSSAGWFCKLGFREESRPVSVFKFKEQWIRFSLSTNLCKLSWKIWYANLKLWDLCVDKVIQWNKIQSLQSWVHKLRLWQDWQCNNYKNDKNEEAKLRTGKRTNATRKEKKEDKTKIQKRKTIKKIYKKYRTGKVSNERRKEKKNK